MVLLVTGAGEEEKRVICRSYYNYMTKSITLAYEVFNFCLFSL
jgi:hypothetical protein